MAGARALWRATGMTDGDFEKPIIAVVNSFTQFVPGHVHLKDMGQLVAREIEAAGGVAKEFNTIAVDDGIAMGHDGMLYSLPSRDIIADSVEYMVNAHCADAMVCISNCDKITPGMLNAAMRLNVPCVFVSGGPMEAGKTKLSEHKLDLVDAMVIAADDSADDATVEAYERSACPTCGSCSGMFTANSMNCLTEALGLSLPGNGSLLATHADREALFKRAGRVSVALARRWYEEDDPSALPRNIANRQAFENAMCLDIAMGGSTNTILHLLAAAQEANLDFSLTDIDALSRRVPQLCKVAPSTPLYHMEDVHRAGGVMAILGELARGGLIDTSTHTVHTASLGEALSEWDIAQTHTPTFTSFFPLGPLAYRRSKPSVRRRGGPALISIVREAASAMLPMPIPRKAASRCYSAILLKTVAWLRPQGSMTMSCVSTAQLTSVKARRPPLPTFWKIALLPVRWLSFVMKGLEVDRVCRKCCIPPAT